MVVPINLSNRKIELVITGSEEILQYHSVKDDTSSVERLQEFISSTLKNTNETDSLNIFIERLSNNLTNVMNCPISNSFKIQTIPKLCPLDFKSTISDLEKLSITLS